MTTRRNIIFILLLCVSFFCDSFAQMTPPPWYESDIELDKANSAVEIDSIAIYNKMISQENAESNYTANVVGIIGGGLLTTLGMVCIFSVAGDKEKSKEPKSKADQFVNSIGEDIASGMQSTINIAGVICILTGLPILAYNIKAYNERKNHAEYRDELQKSLERYTAKKNSAQLIIAPTINLASAGGGLNAILLF